jgi:hypothetical protein
MAKIEADKQIALAQAEAQTENSKAQALQASLTMRMMDLLQRLEGRPN